VGEPLFDSTFPLFVGVTVLATLTPGLAVYLILSTGLNEGRRASALAALGIAAGNSLYLLVCAFGLAALLERAAGFLFVVRLAGAVYLVWLGLRLLLGREPKRARIEVDAPRRTHAFGRGLLTQLANPKAVLYWTALLPQFLNPGRPFAPQIAFLGAVAIVTEIPVLLAYGSLAAWASRRLTESPRVTLWLDRASGVLLITVAALLTLPDLF
jgi:homoserine/homoserine lactone efflux protein